MCDRMLSAFLQADSIEFDHIDSVSFSSISVISNALRLNRAKLLSDVVHIRCSKSDLGYFFQPERS